jgi:hypothetical protein
MKNVTLIIIGSLALLTTPAVAQSSLSITPRAGLNFAAITNVKTGSAKPGLNYGASLDYMFTPRAGIDISALYSMQGVTVAATSNDVNNPGHDYILLPITFKLFFNERDGRPDGFNIFAGGQADILAVTDKVGYTTGYEGKLMPEVITKPFGFSIVAGAGLLLESGLMLSANLNWGLTNIVKDNFKGYVQIDQYHQPITVDLQRDKSYSNLAVQINFGYCFSLTKPRPVQTVDVTFELE